MTCPHTQTTAVLAAFDEAPPDFSAHLSMCEACRTTVAMHRETLDQVRPALEAAPRLVERRPRSWPMWIAGAALAAGTLLMVRFDTAPVPATPTIASASIHDLDALTDPIDLEIDELEMELALFDLED